MWLRLFVIFVWFFFCCLVIQYIKGRQIINFNDVHSVSSSPTLLMSVQFFFRAVNERQTFQVYVLHIIRPFTGFSFQNRRIFLPPLIDVFLLSLL